MVETLAKNRLTRVLPSGMELSHFMVLNHFARLGGENGPGLEPGKFVAPHGLAMDSRGDLYVGEGVKTAWFKDPDGNILHINSM